MSKLISSVSVNMTESTLSYILNIYIVQSVDKADIDGNCALFDPLMMAHGITILHYHITTTDDNVIPTHMLPFPFLVSQALYILRISIE